MTKAPLWTVALLCAAGSAQAQEPLDGSRGRLLYDTHCIACHTTEVHWRDKHLVRSWDGLLVQVARWQANLSLRWNRDDIYAVAGHLNRLHYRFTPTRGATASR